MTGRKTYHHGNLRDALIDAALRQIAETGPQAFSLASAARAAGVSAAAPYRHFKNREDVLEEIALRGFHEFGERVTRAYGDGGPVPLAALGRVGAAYLEFAQERPAYYMAMFESGLLIAENAALWEASENAFGILVRAAEAMAAALPPEDRPPARMVANHIWALSHGVVELFARGTPGARSPISPQDMLRSGVLIYLRGLGLAGR
ncbi:MAG: TetR/AcrR family transcriptional regulator [Paracoccus sp. (in: a-proteobacteria)]|nr:TetR/AcrR family transcriptional regulator [Paracoccus sp. (in: a-proteobacteria)]